MDTTNIDNKLLCLPIIVFFRNSNEYSCIS
jgi:hypothetical protein